MSIHLYPCEPENRPKRGEKVKVLCGEEIIFTAPVMAYWYDGRCCKKCLAGRDSDAYRKSNLTVAFLAE